MADNNKDEEINSGETGDSNIYGRFASDLSAFSVKKSEEESQETFETEELSAFEKRMQENANSVTKEKVGIEKTPLAGLTRRKQTDITEEEKSPEYKKNGKLVGIIIGIIVVIMGAVIAYFILMEGEEAEVVATEPVQIEPAVATASVPSAISSIDKNIELETTCESFVEAGFENCTAVEEPNDEYPRGNIVSQSLPAGSEEAINSEIEIVYSRGPEESAFPEIRDESQEYVEEELYSIGVDIADIETQSHSGIAKDRVIRAESEDEEVEAESTITNGTEVVLLVSDGTVEIPNWIDENREIVESEASEIGIDVEFVTEESEETSGTVLSQSETGTVSNDALIEVTVAAPFEIVEIEIPDVIGESPELAQAELAEEGFREIYIIEIETESVDEATVTQISPSVGSTMLSDNNLTLIISVPSGEDLDVESDVQIEVEE